jgi:hypothetical protein
MRPASDSLTPYQHCGQDATVSGRLGSATGTGPACGAFAAAVLIDWPALPGPPAVSVGSTVAALSFCTWLTLSSVNSATCAIGTPSAKIRTIAAPIFASAASITLAASSRSSCAR